jgi:hypothetical protein
MTQQTTVSARVTMTAARISEIRFFIQFFNHRWTQMNTDKKAGGKKPD